MLGLLLLQKFKYYRTHELGLGNQAILQTTGNLSQGLLLRSWGIKVSYYAWAQGVALKCCRWRRRDFLSDDFASASCNPPPSTPQFRWRGQKRQAKWILQFILISRQQQHDHDRRLAPTMKLSELTSTCTHLFNGLHRKRKMHGRKMRILRSRP